MVKKAKPEKAAAEKKNKPAQETQDSHASPPSIKSGLIKIMLPAMVGSALVTAVCGALR